jgi:arginine deiminase
MNKKEIEKLTNELVNGIEHALQASQDLAFQFNIQPALNAHLILQVLHQALRDMDDQELLDKVMEFVETKLDHRENEADQAVKDLLGGFDNINLN